MRVAAYSLVEVESFPRPLDAGVLYHSKRFNAAAHACACGCGREVITPISPVQWRLTHGARGASLRPSIGNWNFPCRSHYWISEGHVEWAADMSDADIKEGRKFNEKLRERYFEEKNALEQPASKAPAPAPQDHVEQSLLDRLLNWLSKIFNPQRGV